MVNPKTHGCLEPEVIAAYVDHGLSLAERARVDAHLASCPQCVAQLAGVARTVAEISAHLPAAVETTEATPFVTHRGVLVAMGAAAAVLAVVLAPSLVKPWLDRDTGLVSLVDAVGEQRSVLGRLTGGFPHAPLGAPSAGGQDGRAAGTDRVLLAAGRIRESVGERHTPSQLHALGVTELLAGRYDEAAIALLAASREQPANARYLSDLSSVQLERARRGLRPDDLPRALATADRAIKLDPSLKEAWFNRALATSALSLRDQSKAAWAEYLERDDASPWAGEARASLAALSQPTIAEAWTSIEGRLQQSIDPAAADAAVKAQVTEARRYLENELLPAWASAVLAGRDASNELERARVMADAMLRTGGDALYVDAISAIDRAGLAGTLRQIAAAHQMFEDASAQVDAEQVTRAIPMLRAAKAALENAHTPYALRAGSDLANLTYLTGGYAETEQILGAARAEARAHQYAFIEGRASWVAGLEAFAQGRLGDAQANYEATLDTFTRIGDREQVAAAQNLLTGLFGYLGDEDQTLAHLVESLKGLEITRSVKLRHALLMIGAFSLRESNPEAALAIQDEAVQNAERWALPRAIVEASSQRAAILSALGRTADANHDLAVAKQQLLATDTASKARLEPPLLLIETRLARGQDPAAAVAAATHAITVTQARGDRSRLPQLQLELANANIVWGRTKEAEIALERGITAFEAERANLKDEARASVRDEAWGLFEIAVHIAIRKHDYERAFALAERARTRSLAEARKLPATRSLAEIRASLKGDEGVIALNQFDDELAIWAIRRDGVDVVMRPLSRSDAQRLVAQQQDEIWEHASLAAASRALFNEIIRPTSRRMAGVTHLVVVPDTTYENVAFAALADAASGRFLAESVGLNLAPSVNTFAALSQRPTVAAVEAPIVFSGTSDASIADARAVADAYRSAALVTGTDATRERFFASTQFRSAVHIAAPVAISSINPLLSRAMVADEAGAPHSGTIFGRDIASATLNTNLVVLESVEDGHSHRGEGTSSMARAFLAAGVPAVVGTLPGADEDATRDLMIAFHREMSHGLSAAQALQTVQRSAIQQNGRRLGAWSALVLYGSDR